MAISTKGSSRELAGGLAEFDHRSGSLGERALFNNRIWVLLIGVLLTVVLGLQATKVELNASFERMVPTQHPFISNYRTHAEDVKGLSNALRIAVEVVDGTIFQSDYLETLQKISDDLFLLPGVDRPYMKSLWTPSTRWLGVTEEGLEGGPVIPDGYDGSAEAIEELRLNVERSGEIGQLVAPNFKSSIVLVPLLDVSAQTGEALDYGHLSKLLEDIRAKYESDSIRIHITGFGKIVGDLIDGMQQVLLFFAIAIGICSVVLYWYTRCVVSTMLVVACSMVAVIWLLGLLVTLGYGLDPYSILVPFVIFAIGMSHGAQKMNGIMQDIGRGIHRLVAARYTFRRLFRTGMIALITDAIGFAVLMVIDIPVIQDLSVTASIGVAVLILTNLVLLPILLSYLGVSLKAAERSLREERLDALGSARQKHPFWAFLDRFTERSAAIRAVSVAVVAGALGVFVGLDLRIGDLDPGAPELRADSRYNLDNTFLTTNYAASSDVFVVMVRTPTNQCSQWDTLIKVDALEYRLQQLRGVEATNSFASLTRKALAAMSEGNLKWAEIQRNQASINAVTTRAPRELFNQACNMLSLYVYLKDHKADTLNSVVEHVQAFADEYNNEEVQFLLAAGNAGIESATNSVVQGARIQMLVMVYAAVILLAYLSFRSWRAVVCAVLPLMLTSILCEALMVGLGIGVKVATLPVIALGVGIGVDYALYVLSVTLVGLRAGQSLSEAYYRALLFTGKVVVLTGIMLAIAVSTWVLSPIKFQADMGILLAFMFVGNMFGALVLLPALGHFLLRSEGSPGMAAAGLKAAA